MGCSCSGSSPNEEKEKARANRNRVNNRSTQGISNNNSNSNQNNNQNRRIEQRFNNRPNLNQPSYEPYLASNKDPNFNMPQLKEYVGTGIKKMPGYKCKIEKDELEKQIRDFWTSRFEGNLDTWDLIRNLCEGDFQDQDLEELMQASGLTTYAGCINVIFDNKGKLYEIPNYCIHPPLVWDIVKFKIPEPDEEKITIIVRNTITDLKVNTINLCPINELKLYIMKKFDFSDTEFKEGIEDISQIRLFHYGKEMRDNDKLYMHSVNDEKIIQMMLRVKN